MIIIDYQLALFSLNVIPVIFIITFLLKIKDSFIISKNFTEKVSGFIAENIARVNERKAFNGQEEKKKVFILLNNRYFKSILFQVKVNSFLKLASNIFQSFAIILLIWLSISKISNHTLQIGVLYAFTNYIKLFFNSIANLAENYMNI